MADKRNRNLSEEQIKTLRRPLPPEAVKPHPTKPYLSTIKAIYVVERLNEVFGIGGWHIANEVVEHDEKMVVVKSTFYAPEYDIIVTDIFGGNDNVDKGDAYKGACTDALTKIGSYLYIGMDVFKGLSDNAAQPKPAPQGETPMKARPQGGKLTDSHMTLLKLLNETTEGDKDKMEAVLHSLTEWTDKKGNYHDGKTSLYMISEAQAKVAYDKLKKHVEGLNEAFGGREERDENNS